MSKVHDGALYADQGTIAGCAGGTYSNIMEAAYLLDGKSTGTGEFALGVYPSSQPVMVDLLRKGCHRKAHQCRRYHPHRLLRPVLRRRRHPGTWQSGCPSHHAQLPQPRGFQARQWSNRQCCTDGCTQHCRHRCQRRTHHCSG